MPWQEKRCTVERRASISWQVQVDAWAVISKFWSKEVIMCGIFGYLGYLPEEKARVCTDKIRHRGPDGSGIWHTPEITLGHRRLSILDLSDQGKQPMATHDQRYWITFNGEIYNYKEIKERLVKEGYKFRTESDTEVLLYSYDKWKEKSFSCSTSLALWPGYPAWYCRVISWAKMNG